jgi:hypothetical protein
MEGRCLVAHRMCFLEGWGISNTGVGFLLAWPPRGRQNKRYIQRIHDKNRLLAATNHSNSAITKLEEKSLDFREELQKGLRAF